MKTPFLIFLISGLASLQLEPLTSRGVEVVSGAISRRIHSHALPPAPASESKIGCLKEELAEVQLELMKVLETDRTLTVQLESREADLKYALRAEQVRRDEIAQCPKEGKTGVQRLLADARCLFAGAEKPQS